MTAPVASGWSISPGGAFTHWKSAAFARRTPIPAGQGIRSSMAGVRAKQLFMRAAHRQGIGQSRAMLLA